jgi:DNA-directed RNA polymerase alpha subunit
MRSFTDLADLLEEAAKALRQAGELLNGVPNISSERIETLPGYKKLSVRVRKCLRRGNPIETVADLRRCTEQDLLDRKYLGVAGLEQIREVLLRPNGLHLGDESCEG